METKSIECRDPELEQSFSFSGCCDFKSSSSLAIFSDINQSEEDDDDNESYIEIVLEPSSVGDVGGGSGGREEEDDCDDEMELRISLSSGVLLPVETKTSDLYKSVNSCASSLSSSSSSAFTFSSSSTGAESQRNQQVESKLCSCRMQKTIRSKVEFPAVNRFVNTFISSFRESSEIGLGDGRPPDANRLDFLASSNSTRKPSKITTKINSGMMMKFFIKFRALKLGTLLASFLKASQAKSSTDKVKTREESTLWTYNQSLMDKGSLQERKQGERSRALELNLDAIRGVLEGMSIRSLRRKDRRRTKSCPGSTKSSPIHQRFPSETYKISSSAVTDNSIQAAIAHCKRSFGPNI